MRQSTSMMSFPTLSAPFAHLHTAFCARPAKNCPNWPQKKPSQPVLCPFRTSPRLLFVLPLQCPLARAISARNFGGRNGRRLPLEVRGVWGQPKADFRVGRKRDESFTSQKILANLCVNFAKSTKNLHPIAGCFPAQFDPGWPSAVGFRLQAPDNAVCTPPSWRPSQCHCWCCLCHPCCCHFHRLQRLAWYRSYREAGKV